ncbi:hypothetical protein DYB31_010136 [Aphanomyces astaci]|uniref:DNA helicase n=1 Tax=Aphanomyces astaci TaxID=112090 RepID=A0A397EWJ9_APHAT|nr:hypothetical protein DYB31_010136 [Aphanomyces astaci]
MMEQYLLRVPKRVGEELRKKMAEKEVRGVDVVAGADNRNFKFRIDDTELPATLCQLPCIVETHKTYDEKLFYKSGDIGQILLVHDTPEEQMLYETVTELPGGITPPTTNIVKRKYAKTRKSPIFPKADVARVEDTLVKIIAGGIIEDEELVDFYDWMVDDEHPNGIVVHDEMDFIQRHPEVIMLRAVSMITPRGVYVGGNTATTTGLTVTMVKDSSGDYALEAGALVLADQGVCCIDEFDKMACDYQALLEAMEQQSISIAKAGIVCNLNARTSVIAAANPSGGHYNRSRSVSENLKMKAALDDPISLYHIRRYIAYARKYIHPQLSQEARQYLQDKYLQMRSDAETAAGDGIPITMRQLESLIRLAQARAKIELQDVVTVQHAYDVVEIMQECLLDTYTTEEGHLDFGRSGGMSLAKKVKAYVARLRKSVAQRNSQLFSMDELLQVANSMALDVDDFRDFVEILRNECFVLKQGVNVYKVQI